MAAKTTVTGMAASMRHIGHFEHRTPTGCFFDRLKSERAHGKT
jgi:hypothetical protein